MKKYLLCTLLLSLNTSAHTLCERIQNGIAVYLEHAESRIDFKNQGGLLGGGVCWWHARLQRSSAYLTEFARDLPPPGPKELQQILISLRQMTKVVVIPGFDNFNSFSRAYQKEVQQMLESWQREDGFINQQWIRGISGKYELPADELKEKMQLLHQQFLISPHPVWIMAQIKGIASHAFLILDMTAQIDGYDLKLIDSNHPTEIRLINYVYGEKFLKHQKEKYAFVPYLGFQKDFLAIKESVTQYCGKSTSFEMEHIPVGDIELVP